MRHAIAKHARDFAAVVGLAVIAIAIGGYILSHQRLRFPFVEDKPVEIYAEFSNAQAVTPGQGQTIRVAGMQIGDIGEVELRDGRAIVRMDIDREHEGLIRSDATALLRPRTGLKDMFIALDPGTNRDKLEDGDTIPAESTSPDVNPDEILSVLDADTRDYLKLLIDGAGKGLRGRSDDLREVFRRLGPLHRDLARLNRMVATRRAHLARLVTNYGGTVDRLAREDERLSEFVSSADTVFDELADEDARISEAVSRLPSTLRAVRGALVKVRELGETAGPTFEALRPAVRQIADTNRELEPLARESEPILREQIRPFVRAAQPYLRDNVAPAARNLSRASPDLRESFYELNRLFNIAAYNPGGAEPLTGNPNTDLARDEGYLFWLGWVVQNTNSLLSTGDAQGPFRRFLLSASCSTFLALTEQNPALEPLTGIGEVLSDATLCPAD